MDYNKIVKTLKAVGFTENEIKLYTALSRSGVSSVSDISKTSGIYRTLIYQIIDRLIEKGLVIERIIGKKRYFEAVNPNRLEILILEREKQINKNLKDIVKFFSSVYQKSEKPGIKTYFGIEGLKTALQEEINSIKGGDYYFVFHAIPEIPRFLPIFISEYHKKRIRKKITVKAIYDSRQESLKRAQKLAKTKYTEIRILPEKYKSLLNYHIYNDNILIISSVDSEVICILIESQKISEGFRENFISIWKKLKPINL